MQPGGAIAGGSSQSKEAGYLHRKGELLELKDYLASERKVLRDAKINMKMMKQNAWL